MSDALPPTSPASLPARLRSFAAAERREAPGCACDEPAACYHVSLAAALEEAAGELERAGAKAGALPSHRAAPLADVIGALHRAGNAGGRQAP